MKKEIIRLENLFFKYNIEQKNSFVLNNITLTVYEKDFILLAGESGSGKSTLCRALNGLIPHFHQGEVKGSSKLFDKSFYELKTSDISKKIGTVFQNKDSQIFNSTVKKEISFGLERLGLSGSDIKKRIDETIELLEIKHLLDKKTLELSDGEKALTIIASIYALAPKVIILDEPYANLDLKNIHIIQRALKKINKKGAAVIICEHRISDAIKDANRMLVMKNGKIIFDDSPLSIIKNDLKKYNIIEPFFATLSKKYGLEQTALNEKTFILNKNILEKIKTEKKQYAEDKLKNKILKVENISFSKNKKIILKNINFSLYENECISLIGSNGAGKTTLIKMLNRLNRTSSGAVYLYNENIKKYSVSKLAKQIGFVFQNPNDQFFRSSVDEEINFSPELFKQKDKKWSDDLIKKLRLKNLLGVSPYKLSEGEKKRVSFASVISYKPNIIILDEPTAGQDAHYLNELKKLIYFLKKNKFSIVIVTHDLDFAYDVSDRFLLLGKNTIIKDDLPHKVLSDKKSLLDAGLLQTERIKFYIKAGILND